MRHYTYLGLVAAIAMTGCSSTPYTSPIYTQNQVAGSYGNTASSGYAQPVNASYNTASNTVVDPECLKRETNRELLGGAVGGTAGAFVGKELIGGTKGVIAGAALGGIAGYGVGNLSTKCEAVAAPTSNTVYQGAQSYGATPASFNTVSCPTGTAAQANGTCLVQDASFNAPSINRPSISAQPAQTQFNTVQSANTHTANTQTFNTQYGTYTAAPTTVTRQYEAIPHTYNVTRSSTAAASPTQYTPQVPTYGSGIAYQVQTGDTVYSLARKLCVSVSEIQGTNNLDASYGIKIGQSLQLPANRC